MSNYLTPTALMQLRDQVVGKPVTQNGQPVGLVIDAVITNGAFEITLRVDDPRGMRLLGCSDFKVDV